MSDRLPAYLPRVMADDPFLQRFLRIVEELDDSVRDRVAGLADYLDAGTAPLEFVEWLGRWVDVAVVRDWPEARQRDYVRRVGPLFRWRGTRVGLEGVLSALLDRPVEVVDPAGVGREAPVADPEPVRIRVPAGSEHTDALEKTIRKVLPVDVAYVLETDRGGGAP